jgi:two-component system, NarL family, sensor kinase
VANPVTDFGLAGRPSPAVATMRPVNRKRAIARKEFPPVSVSRLVARFTLAGVIAVAILVIGLAWVSRRAGTSQAIDEAERVTRIVARGVVEPALQDGLLEGDPAALADLDGLVREAVLVGSLVRVKMWAADGTVVYSDESRLIGQTFEMDDEHLVAFTNGLTEAEVSSLDQPENVLEQDDSRLVEVYTGVKTPDGTPLLFEAYFQYDAVVASGRRIWRDVVPVAIGALVLLELVQIPAAWSLARRLRRGQRQRETLLQHAVDASDTERRRIARDLHDGVVQDLAGVSFALGAAARAPEVPASTQAVLDDSARAVRDSIGSLRSLLVEIYPPNLESEGLPSALNDLLARYAGRGIGTDLHVGFDDRISMRAESLLYRSAQEALRNVATHAAASNVAVSVDRLGETVVMEVNDDGRGFDPKTMRQAGSTGHVGLQGVMDLVAEAGGKVEVRSALGKGTVVRVEVPR